MMGRPYRNIGFFFLLLLALVIAGFTPKVTGTPFFGYFSQLLRGGQVPWVIHLHAWVALVWFGLLTIQPFLIRSNCLAWHRWLGRFSIMVVALFMITAIQMMKHFYQLGIEKMPRDVVLSALAQSFTALSLFLLFYVIALLRRRNIHQHVAFLVAASLAAATPGLARLGLYIIGGLPGILTVVVCIYATLLAFLLYTRIALKQAAWRSPYLPIMLLFLMAHVMDFAGSRTATWLWLADKMVSAW
jgi:hypothetical protein